jgi:hypothetical protein
LSARRWVWIAVLLSAVSARADPGAVGLFGGLWGLPTNEPHEVAVQLEYRFGVHWWWLRPLGGMLLSSEGTQVVYAGLLLEVPLPWGFVVAPGVAPGLRILKGERDLGATILFKSSIEVSFPIASGLRAAASFAHISNAKLGSPNPGVETLLVGFDVELR